MIRGSSGRLPKQRFALLWVAIVVALSCVAGIVPHSHSTATAQADLALQASSLLSRQTVLAEPQMRGHSTAGPLQLLAEALIVDEMEPPRYSSWTVLYPFERGGPENGWYDSSWSDDTYAEHAFYTYAGDRWVSEEYNNWGIWTALDGLPYFGEWEVYAYIPRVSTGHSPTSLARYTIRRYPDDSGIPREADQRGGPRWQSLGCYEFDSGIQQAPSVQLVVLVKQIHRGNA